MSVAGPAVLDRVRAASRRVERGDWHGGGLALHAALLAVPARLRAHPVVRRGWRRLGAARALDECWDDAGRLEPDLRAAAGGDVGRRLELEGARAVGLVLAGRTADAARVGAAVRRIAADAAMTTLCAELDLADALVTGEAGDHLTALSSLERATGQAVLGGSGPLVAQLALVDLLVGCGRPDEARSRLAQVEHAARGRHDPAPDGGARSSVACAHVGLALACDDVDAAHAHLPHVTDPFWRPVLQARTSLARGRDAEAEAALARALPRCPRHEVVGGLVLAHARWSQDRAAAVEQAGAALEVAVAHGMLRSAAVVAAPPALVEHAAWRVPEGWLDALRHRQAPAWTAVGSPSWPLEPLTRREQDVLRLLPGRLTLREVADELVVSPNTLKFHLRLIYRKLGAGSRTEAVAVARREGLLPRG